MLQEKFYLNGHNMDFFPIDSKVVFTVTWYQKPHTKELSSAAEEFLPLR